MRTPSMGSSSRRSFGHRRIIDILADDQESDDEGIAPVFLSSDGSDLVEVMLELDHDSMVLRSVATVPPDTTPTLSRSSSTTSRIRRKFSWLRSPSPRLSSASASANDFSAIAAARDARRAQARLARTRSGAKRALKGLKFISHTTSGSCGDPTDLWRRVEDRFNKLSRDGLLSRDDFGECIGMGDSKEFATGIFDALARRRRQTLERISKEELYEFWLQISDQSFDARLQIFFDMADTNEDGRITREELEELIVLSASANKLSKLKEQAAEYAALIMEELDPENFGYIELWQLEGLLLQRDSYMSYSRPLSTASGGTTGWSQGLGPSRPARSWLAPLRRAAIRARLAAQIGWRRAWVIAAWVAAMAGLFAWKFVQYRRRAAFEVMGYCLPTAKGAAETLKLNMALVLLPVCRNTLTWLRSTKAHLFVPFDDNINFHKMIAMGIVIGILVHAGNHLTCDFPRVIRSSPEQYAIVARDFGSEKPTFKSLLFGVEGVTGIAMVVLMAISFTLATHPFRKNGGRLPYPLNKLTGFNAFWYSHHLLAIVYVLLIVHGYFMFLVHRWYQRTTWMYISVPLLLYIGERTLRAFRSQVYSVKILKVSLLPGSVLTIIMSKPHGFRHRSGQYIFLQCPTISSFEWHPFSITSAPGDDHLSVHIRTIGDWTQELKRIFIEHHQSPSFTGRAKLNQFFAEKQSLPRLLVDGPYGAPAQDYRNFDVLLLVGLGIGATPFISILRDLLNNIKTAEELMDSTTETSTSDDSNNSFNVSTASSSKKRSPRTTSAHFYWVTREAGSFEWFKGVMDEVAGMDKKGVIEMHNYLTSVYEEGDARTTLLAMVQAINHAKHGVDIVSGTRVRTHFARPNWNEVFARISSKHPGATVGVFYCGNPVLAKELKKLSHESSHKTSTRFHFHKEYF
ncbi:LOW QUALITY PROTEIN: respiratory burst oxidase homolog protein E-like [Dioscorea cayenensis subsp. rotundata]|uniref:LOW QUALITY PROTEIN: respiratory burst oxidase homolog protein E-like n=1 Tax=Dioscorea cayennensis subsp. rotundata TaxID=55577 RepID=A0AB40BL20_DIOCR|nr:LOW QUALITY PROTEIN: respiratory burst oxidase homolog protein E-like [Dioscorea cayenensis subsp. rotundata]